MNQVVLIGRLTRDPELRFISSSGTAIARFAIAVNREYKRDGQSETDFFNIVVWGKSAENCANYLKKGRLVAINGKMQNNNYEDKNGVKHYTIEIHANRVQFLEWGDDNKRQNQSYSSQGQRNSNQQYQSNQNDSLDGFDGFQAIDGDDNIPL